MIATAIFIAAVAYMAFRLGQASMVVRALDERESLNRLGPAGASRSSSVYDHRQVEEAR